MACTKTTTTIGWGGGGFTPRVRDANKFTARLRRSASEPKVKHVLLTDTSLHFYITLVGFLTHWTRTRHRFCNRWVTPESQIQAKWLRCLLMVINRGRGPLRVLPLVHLSNWHIINKHLNCCHDPIPTPTAASRPPLFSKKGPPPPPTLTFDVISMCSRGVFSLFHWNKQNVVCFSETSPAASAGQHLKINVNMMVMLLCGPIRISEVRLYKLNNHSFAERQLWRSRQCLRHTCLFCVRLMRCSNMISCGQSRVHGYVIHESFTSINVSVKL